MKFKLEKEDPQSKARAGEITTDHGTIKTPIFMPVGTASTVKGVHQHELEEDIKAQINLCKPPAFSKISVPGLRYKW